MREFFHPQAGGITQCRRQCSTPEPEASPTAEGLSHGPEVLLIPKAYRNNPFFRYSSLSISSRR